MLDEILDKLPENSLNESLQKEVTELFESKVESAAEAKAVKLAEGLIHDEVALKETQLLEKYETAFSDYKNKVDEIIGDYINKVVDEFVNENKELLKMSIDSAHSNLVLESFESMVNATGADILAQVKNHTDDNYESLAEKYDVEVSENLKLKKELNVLKNKVMIQEAAEGLTVSEKDKFVKLANLVDEKNLNESTLSELKKQVQGLDNNQSVNESVNVSNTTKPEEKPSWSRFV